MRLQLIIDEDEDDDDMYNDDGIRAGGGGEGVENDENEAIKMGVNMKMTILAWTTTVTIETIEQSVTIETMKDDPCMKLRRR